MTETANTDRVRLEVTDRAMRQDAELAMGNDPVRALVELITNCDDAYGPDHGRIAIELNRGAKDWSFEVRDRASGMRQQDMQSKLLRQGARTSGFEKGAIVRGNLGRGAKDVSSFGCATFESIKDGRYTCCKIYRAVESEFAQSERDAADADRQRLGINRNGTVVTVEVTNGTRCPQLATLKRELANHYQLRDIMQSPKREITVALSGAKPEPLRFKYPSRQVVVDENLVPEGYPDAGIHLKIWRLDNRDEGGLVQRERRISGLLVKGQRAIYENTFFSSESRAASRWFAGECEIPYIDELARQYDDNFGDTDPMNPMGIIRRDREGLVAKHPFYQAVRASIDPILAKLIEEEEKRVARKTSKISQRLTRDLGQLGRDLARMFSEDTEETDEELPQGPKGPRAVGPIEVIPGKIVLYMGETKTVSVRVAESVRATRIRIETLPPGRVRVLEGDRAKLVEGRTTLQIEPRQVGEGVLMIRAGDKAESVVLDVRAERPPPPPPPTTLEFEHESYSVKEGRTRNLRLQAPEEVIFEHGDRVSVSVKGDSIVRKGGELQMLPNEDGIFECLIPVEGRASAGRVTITAVVGDTTAMANAHISTPAETQGQTFHFEIENASAGAFRAEIKGNVVRIFGRHPAVERLIGKAPEFPQQDDPIGRAAIAEIVASEVTRKIVEAKFRGKDVDAAAIYFEHRELLSRYLKKCQSVLLPG